MLAVSSILSLQAAGVAFNVVQLAGGSFQMGSRQLGQDPRRVSVGQFGFMETHVTNELMDAYIGDMRGMTYGMVGFRKQGQGFVLGRTDPRAKEKRDTKVLDSARRYLSEMHSLHQDSLVPPRDRYESAARTEDGKPAELFNGPRHPAVLVNWFQGLGFAQWLSEQTGKTFYFPTEAQWEYAVKAGAIDVSLPSLARDVRIHWQARATASVDREVAYVNEYRIRDPIGNAWVWTSTWRGPYSREDTADPLGSPEGYTRILRGASWMTANEDRNGGRIQLHPSFRGFGRPYYMKYNIGVRLSMAVDPERDPYLRPR